MAAAPVESEFKEPQFPDEDVMQVEPAVWKMYFDGASNKKGFGVGVVIVTLEGEHIPMAFKLAFSVTNNTAEYEACIAGLEAALHLGIKHLKVYGDSSLIVSQALGKWKIKAEQLVPYHQRLTSLAQQFKELSFHYLLRAKNQLADALATLASMVDVNKDMVIRPLTVKIKKEPAFCMVTDRKSVV